MGNAEAKHASEAHHADGVALMEAAHSGDVEGMDALLKKNPALMYAHSKDGENVWHFAARGGQVQVLRAFHAVVDDALQHQKRPDKFISQVNHAFNTAAVTVNGIAQLPSQLNIPMGKDVSINAPTRQGITPLMASVQAGKVEALQFLLAHGADAWKADARGNVALHHAAVRTDPSCLSALIAHADKLEAPDLDASDRMVNAHNNAGLTPMHFAAWGGAGDCLKLLVNHGGLFLVSTSGDSLGDISCNAGSTPLHLAAIKGDLSTIRLLLRAYSKLCEMERAGGGAAVPPDPRCIKDRYGKTPHDTAIDVKRLDVAEVLEPRRSLEAAVKGTSKAASSAPRSKMQHSGSIRSQSAALADTQTPEPPAAREACRSSVDCGNHADTSTAASSHSAAVVGNELNAPAAAAAAAPATACNSDKAAAGAAPKPRGPEPPEDLVCPLTNELMKDPVVAADGHAYERSAIEVWFELGNTSFPGGHTRISHTRLVADEALRTRVATWKAQMGA